MSETRNLIAREIVRWCIANGEEFFPNPLADRIMDKVVSSIESENAALKAQPVRVVDAEKLKESLEKELAFRLVLERVGVNMVIQLIDSLAIPQPDYPGALHTLANIARSAILPAYGKTVDDLIAYALAHPTEEGK